MRMVPIRISLFLTALLLLVSVQTAKADGLFIPMDLSQTDHLRAYGITYNAIEAGAKAEWLLNYRGGSFLIEYHRDIERVCRLKGVRIERISDGEAGRIYAEVEQANMEVIRLEKAPKIAIYSPPDTEPWDDAVTMALEYAEIPYEKVYDDEVLTGRLYDYDWLHLHHEDFTGQYGKFWANYRNADWYLARKANQEARAKRLGFAKVSQLKLAISRDIRLFVEQGGFLFAMCSATDSYDIAQAAAGHDICDAVFDGDPQEPDAQSKLDFNRTWAFKNFHLISDPSVYEFSDIDATPQSGYSPRGDDGDYFAQMTRDLADLYREIGQFDKAEALLLKCHAIFSVNHGDASGRAAH